jgi:hypothetical protein
VPASAAQRARAKRQTEGKEEDARRACCGFRAPVLTGLPPCPCAYRRSCAVSFSCAVHFTPRRFDIRHVHVESIGGHSNRAPHPPLLTWAAAPRASSSSDGGTRTTTTRTTTTMLLERRTVRPPKA